MIFTATEILSFAFGEFLKASAGEAAKKLTSETLVKANELRQMILRQFKRKKNGNVEKLIMEIEKGRSAAAFEELAEYLRNEMNTEKEFSKALQKIARQIREPEDKNPMIGTQNIISSGKDQIVINSSHGSVHVSRGY